MVAVRVLVFVLGLMVVLATLFSSFRTVILPRGVPARLARVVFRSTRAVFRLRIGRNAPYARRDRIMALYGPLSLLVLLVAWLSLVMAGFTLMFWAIGGRTWHQAFAISGSSLLTLGFERPADVGATVMVFAEAGIGLVELALLITYMPSLYSAFSRREALVTALEVRAGAPPTGETMLIRFHVLGRLEKLSEEVWTKWEDWFADIEESHTSFPALAFFRSPQPDHSWVTAAGAVLDAAALTTSTLACEREPQADICIRAGYLALRRIAAFFGIPYEEHPQAEDPISITREDFDGAYDRMKEAGVPVVADRDGAWRDFAGWRVNYDTVLLALAVLTDAPKVAWSSDRSMGDFRDLMRQRRQARRQG